MKPIQPPSAEPPPGIQSSVNSSANLRWKLVALAVCYWLGLVAITHWPGTLLPKFHLRYADKLLHSAIFAGLAVVLCLLASVWRRPSWGLSLAIFGLLAVYAAVDEFTQAFVPLREPSVKDWIADVAGAAAGVLLFAIGHRLLHRPGEREASASR